MSMNHEVRLRNLEERLKDLEAFVQELRGSTVDTSFYVKRVFGGFGVFNGEEKASEKPLSRADAEALADELNKAAA